MTYLDKILYLYPNIQNVMYWYTHYDGTPWADPYDGLEWNNNDIKKPTKEILDALDENTVSIELSSREAASAKIIRNYESAKNLGVLAGFNSVKISNPNLIFSDYLDQLEALKID